MWFPNRSYTNQAAQSQKQAKSLNFRIEEEEEVDYRCSENKGADQLRGYRKSDLRLCFRICRLLVFSRGGSSVLSSTANATPQLNLNNFLWFQLNHLKLG